MHLPIASQAWMMSAFYFEAFALVDAAGDIENPGLVEEIGSGEAKALVAIGLGEIGLLFRIYKYRLSHE